MKTIYTNVNILDGTKEMVLQKNMMICVEDGIITSIQEAKKDIEGNIIDLQNRYLIPGLINLHVHLPGSGFPKKKQSDPKKLAKLVMSNPLGRLLAKKLCQKYARTELFSGTTTIRTVGGLGSIDTSIRDDINAKKCIGPRMVCCNQALTVSHGHMEGSVAIAAQTPEEFATYVQKNADENVDWIKLMITGGVLDAKVKGEPGEMRMNAQQIKACTDMAHQLGLKVCAHTESPLGVRIALENGVDSIEHGSAMDDEIITLFQQTKAVEVCTLSPAIPLAKFSSEITKATEITQYNSKVLLEGMIAGVKKCLENRVVVGLGTDTACPFITHYDTWRELEYFHQLVGVSRQFALHTATLVNAEILGLQKVTGSIEVGKSADFIIVDDNPLDGFVALKEPYMVHFRNQNWLQPKIKKNKLCEKLLDSYLGSLI